MALGPHVHGVGDGVQAGVGPPPGGDLGGERRRGPGVHHVGVADEAAGAAPVGLVAAGRGVGGGVDGEAVPVGLDGAVPVGGAVVAHRVPQGDGHPEEALAADQPVAVEPVDPALVAGPHVAGHPVHLPAPLHQGPAQLGLAAAVADVPLAARHDLQGPVALLEELHRVGYGPGLSVHLAGLGQDGGHLRSGPPHRPAGQPGVGGPARGRGHRLGRLGGEAAVAPDHRPHRQVELAPPGDVGGVAEGADHGRAGALFGVGQLVGLHRHLHVEHRAARRGADQRPVALVVGVGHQGHARHHQLGPGGVDPHVSAAVGGPEAELVVGAGPLPVLQLGLGHRGAEGDVPQRRGVDLVGLAPLQVLQEGELGHPAAVLVDGGVGAGPVHRQAQVPEQVLEGLLVLDGQPLAQIDEVGPADRDLVPLGQGFGVAGVGGRGEVGVVGQGRVAAHAVVVLHPALGGQPVVVPAHGVEDGPPGHALVAGDGVGVGVAEHVAHVQGAAHRGRRGVDGEDPLPGLGGIEPVDPLVLPDRVPAGFDPLEAGPVGHRDGTGLGSGGGHTGDNATQSALAAAKRSPDRPLTPSRPLPVSGLARFRASPGVPVSGLARFGASPGFSEQKLSL